MDGSGNTSSTDTRCHNPPVAVSDSTAYCSGGYLFDMNDDRTNLISDRVLKEKKCCRRCSLLRENKSYTQPWIAFTHILCTALLALFGVYLTSNVLIFEKRINDKEMDDIGFRSSTINQYLTTQMPSLTDLPPSKDNCEPLYILIYAHCCVWFLFLILDHVARHIHHKMLRCRGHLRAYVRLSALACIPFQLVSLWTVLLAIFITVYTQQDKADMQPYCDANALMSPKNGIAVLLVIEFICVTIISLMYAYSIRKFSLDKPPPDVYGWQENNYCNRWTPQLLLRNDSGIQEQINSESREQNGQCLLDVIDYYMYTNRELATILGRTSQRLHQLEVESESLQIPPQS